jgi:hypothetical protein
MRHDTKPFADNQMIARNFNVMQTGLADPFLTQLSLQGRAVAGNDIRALKQQK